MWYIGSSKICNIKISQNKQLLQEKKLPAIKDIHAKIKFEDGKWFIRENVTDEEA